MIYHLGFLIYISLFRTIALFHTKAKKMVVGHREAWKILKKGIDPNRPWLWFHAASLGEFEQGRPIMERIRAEHPEYGILLTFYSPSGYEVRKNFPGADIVCYLPFDTLFNVYRFLNIVKPKKAFFIKYEFWPNYLTILRHRKIPTYLISGIFRKDQLFFRPYGFSYRRLLKTFTHLFVQNLESVELLQSIGRKQGVSISGDTRYDRVLEIRDAAKDIPVAEAFAKSTEGTVMIAGSSWPKDESIFIPYFNSHPEVKLIIAPHEIHEEHLSSIEHMLKRPFKRLSQTTIEEAASLDCIIIDCFGMLSSVYRYGHIAYIGGGFGVGIHNTLEAAVYGIPVVFGPNYYKFHEAKELIVCGGAYTIFDEREFAELMERFRKSPDKLREASRKAGEMVFSGSGGTARIVREIPL